MSDSGHRLADTTREKARDWCYNAAIPCLISTTNLTTMLRLTPGTGCMPLGMPAMTMDPKYEFGVTTALMRFLDEQLSPRAFLIVPSSGKKGRPRALATRLCHFLALV